MKKIILTTAISLALVVALLFAGCSSVPTADSQVHRETPVDNPTDVPTGNTVELESKPVELPVLVSDDEIYSDITYIEDKGIPELIEGFGIYGSTVEFEGVFPGWIGTVPLTIVNGQDKERLFVLSISSPSKTRTGFEPLPKEYFCWITISEPEVTVAKGETYQIPITLEMPMDADYSGKRAEVRIRISDTTQTGLVQIALENRWFIITAD